MPNNDDWVKKTLESIENKVDKLDTRIDNVDVTLGRQSVILQDHTRRSLANERAVELLKTQIELNKEQTHNDLKPIQIHVTQVHTVFKIIGVAASVFAILEGALKVVEFFKSFL